MHTILNLSGVYGDEGWDIPGSRKLDLSGIEGCRRYCDAGALRAIRSALAQVPVRGVHWIDTGDYHYISLLWMEKIDFPFVLALFDNHPDDQAPAFGSDLLSCGSWVLSARGTLPMMKADYRNTASIPGNLPAFLSIDIDVLSEKFARTGWSQGDMDIAALLGAAEEIALNHKIIAVDICGGLTAAQGAGPEDLRINTECRKRLLDYFTNHPPAEG